MTVEELTVPRTHQCYTYRTGRDLRWTFRELVYQHNQLQLQCIMLAELTDIAFCCRILAYNPSRKNISERVFLGVCIPENTPQKSNNSPKRSEDGRRIERGEKSYRPWNPAKKVAQQ